LSVHHPDLPLGPICLPIPSFLLYGLACLAACLLQAGVGAGPRWRLRGSAQIDPGKLGRHLVRLAHALLCSGGYVLLEVQVPDERLRVRVRLV